MNKKNYLEGIRTEIVNLRDDSNAWKWTLNHREVLKKMYHITAWVDSPVLHWGDRFESETCGKLWWVYPATMTDKQILEDLEKHGVNIEGSGLSRVPEGERIITNVLVYKHTKRKVLAIQEWELSI